MGCTQSALTSHAHTYAHMHDAHTLGAVKCKRDMAKVHVQDLATVRLNETVEELADKLTASADAVLAMSEADLAEAIEAYSSMTKDGGIGVVASEEDEDLFACRAALLRLHHLQLLTKAPAEMPDVYIRLQKLLQVLCSLVGRSVCLSRCICLTAAHMHSCPAEAAYSVWIPCIIHCRCSFF